MTFDARSGAAPRLETGWEAHSERWGGGHVFSCEGHRTASRRRRCRSRAWAGGEAVDSYGVFHQGQKSNGWKVTMVTGGLAFCKAVILTVAILRRSFRCEHVNLGIGGSG